MKENSGISKVENAPIPKEKHGGQTLEDILEDLDMRDLLN